MKNDQREPELKPLWGLTKRPLSNKSKEKRILETVNARRRVDQHALGAIPRKTCVQVHCHAAGRQLEVVISGHTEPITGTACPLESSDFRDISNQRNYSDQVLSRLRSSSGVRQRIAVRFLIGGV
jgi:hypothetical protein